jgi:PAS domain S-box-containing protein
MSAARPVSALRANGEEFPVEASISQIEVEGQKLYTVIMPGITERKRAEQALKDSESEMQALFSSMTDVILVLDAEGRHLKIAPSKTSHLYKPAAERIGRTVHEIFPKETADLYLTTIHEVLADRCTHRLEYSLMIAGEERWYDANVSPMSGNSVVWVARDITERKRRS